MTESSKQKDLIAESRGRWKHGVKDFAEWTREGSPKEFFLSSTDAEGTVLKRAVASCVQAEVGILPTWVVPQELLLSQTWDEGFFIFSLFGGILMVLYKRWRKPKKYNT